jgi:curli production assembly/transport component CsgG
MQMEIPQRLLCLSVIFLFSCTNWSVLNNYQLPVSLVKQAEVGVLINKELADIGKPFIKPTIAVYPNSFTDQTGQRRSNSTYASFSTAITQAPNAYLIRALKHAGDGHFFDVVERVGLDNLTKERQLIRSTRKDFKEDKDLLPLTFAGLLMEGGVIGYESNVKSGGLGARYLGIGTTKEYRQDSVTVSLRTVSVSTGKVLTEVLTTKTILSVALSQDAFRFISSGTELVEIENGMVENESVNIALQSAVETAVLETIKLGVKNNLWSIPDEEMLNAIRG